VDVDKHVLQQIALTLPAVGQRGGSGMGGGGSGGSGRISEAARLWLVVARRAPRLENTLALVLLLASTKFPGAGPIRVLRTFLLLLAALRQPRRRVVQLPLAFILAQSNRQLVIAPTERVSVKRRWRLSIFRMMRHIEVQPSRLDLFPGDSDLGFVAIFFPRTATSTDQETTRALYPPHHGAHRLQHSPCF